MSTIKSLYTVFVLKLEDDKYFIGSYYEGSNYTDDEILQVYNEWTNRYKPKSILEKHYKKPLFYDNELTVKYMCKYGMENVRGGLYTHQFLDKETIDYLIRKINEENNRNNKSIKNYFSNLLFKRNKIDNTNDTDYISFV